MSKPVKESVVFNDAFIPKKLDKVECIEVVSKSEARKFILVHPKTAFLENLEIKDQFVWECIDGETSLGDLKQKYYQKFKVIPSQQLVEKMRRWHERGFLEGGGLKKRSSVMTGAVGVALPAQLFRVTLGQITRLLVNKMMAIMMVVIGLLTLSFTGYSEGIFFIFEGFSSLPIWKLFACIFIGAHIGNIVRILLMLGALSPAPTYRGDRLLIGFWGPIPVLSLDLMGLRLKPREKRLAGFWVNWSASLFIAGVFSVAPMVPALSEWKVLFYSASMGCLIDFVMQSCPFYYSRLIRAFDELGGGVSIQRLKVEYSKGRDLFLSNYSELQEKAVQWSTIALVFWIVLGSSFLLFSAAQTAEALTELLREGMNMEAEQLEKVQWFLYLPVLLAFFLLLWKLIQPFVQRMMSMPVMRDDRVMIGVQIGLIGLVPLISMVLPELLLQFGLVVGVIGIFIKVTASLKGEHWTFRVQSFLMCLTAVSVIFSSLYDLYRVESQMGLSFLWLLWTIARVECLSPRAPGWWIKIIMASAVSLALILGVSFAVQFPLDARLMYALSAALSFGTAVLMIGGSLGWQILPLGFGFWSMFFGSILIPVNTIWGQVFYGLGLIFIGLSHLSWIKCRDKLMHKIPHIVKCDPEDFRYSLEETLNEILKIFVGKNIINELGAKGKSDVLFLGSYERWIKRWMPRYMTTRIMQESIGSIPWDHRAHWSGRLERYSAPKQVKNFTDEMRYKFLKSQLMFRGFSAEELDLLVQYLELQPYRKGEYLASNGEAGHPYLEIVASGQLRIQEEEVGEPDPKVLADLGQKEAIRSEDLFSDQPYNFDAVWMNEGLTIKLHRVQFLLWGKEHPQLLKKVLGSLALSEMISKLSLFKDFSNSQMRLLMEKLEKIEVPAGHDVIEEGKEGDEFFLLDRGEVEVLVKNNQVAKLGAGSYFGEIALLQKCLRTASIRTTKPSTLYALVQKDFDRFFSSGRGAQVLENVSQNRGVS